ncbi:N-carbamoylputrescine amidase [Candidatus Uhrbacteria bacterium]|nr:N-carbamoylputrescine amidase [Candidatus Uhrbacteria bacterium]
MKSRIVNAAVIQCALGGSRDDNARKVKQLIDQAARAGANVVVAPELFETPYFCRTRSRRHFQEATTLDRNPLIADMRLIARRNSLVIPFSFFEDGGDGRYFNTVAMIDADGRGLGTYRKSHIPTGPGYWERRYFEPGDTGFKVWRTKHGKIGVGICWDQWFPECARAMALDGADLLLYPSTIGAEPHRPDLDTRDRWRRVMIGHAVANVIPIAAANRTGVEDGIAYYGSSFVCDDAGEIVADMGRVAQGFAMAQIDINAVRRNRRDWGLTGYHRRPDLYGALVKKD